MHLTSLNLHLFYWSTLLEISSLQESETLFSNVEAGTTSNIVK